jgi:hypothetical protein
MSPTISVSLNGLQRACIAQVQAYFTNGTALNTANITVAWSSIPVVAGFALNAVGTTSAGGFFSTQSVNFPRTGSFTCTATITRLSMVDNLGTYQILPTATLTAQRIVR